MFDFFRRLFSGGKPACPLTVGQATPTALADSDGISPGVDLDLVDTVGIITFTGVFYANPAAGNVTIKRVAHVVFASTEVLVTQDVTHGNLYVIDRIRNLSLGCRMTAHYKPDPSLQLQAA